MYSMNILPSGEQVLLGTHSARRGNCLLPLKTSNLTRYNALSETWGGNEAPFHCRKYTPQLGNTKAPQCAKDHAQSRCFDCRSGNRRRPAYP